MATRVSAALIALLLAGCAGVRGRGGTAERSYRRAEVDSLRLRAVDLVVVAAGPPRVAGEVFDVRTFDPPNEDAPLLVGTEDPATRNELARAYAKRLAEAGYTVGVIAASLASTASTATSSTSPLGFRVAASLDGTTTLRGILERSHADAVLVVRAVPVDSFVVDLGTGTRVEYTPLGKETVRDFRPVQREGRLLVGQSFLFDRKTGLRLWTKQAPDYPEEGRVTVNHPFLAYGYVHEGSSPPPTGEIRARLAADRFAQAMLRDFPAAKEGSPEARAALDTLDTGFEEERQAFLDRGHFAVDMSGSWSAERATMDLALFGNPLESVGSSALLPYGLARATPRVSYLSAGGLTWMLGVPLGFASPGFSRAYRLDQSSASEPAASFVVKVNRLNTYGVELQAGSVREILPSLFLIPRGGLFAERWTYDASPGSVLGTQADATRAGVIGGADLWLRVGQGHFYGRAGFDLRLGADFSGPFVIGTDLSFGLGLML
jgi:hypothetical protein